MGYPYTPIPTYTPSYTNVEFTKTAYVGPNLVTVTLSRSIVDPIAFPRNTVAPAITGTPTVGEILTVSDGTWTGEATISYTYAWYRDGVVIPNETTDEYTLQGADEDTLIYAVVTATNDLGVSSAQSNTVGPIAAA